MIGIVAVITQANRKPILPDLIVGLLACAVAVAGAVARIPVACRIVAAAPRRTAAAALGYASLSKTFCKCKRVLQNLILSIFSKIDIDN